MYIHTATIMAWATIVGVRIVEVCEVPRITGEPGAKASTLIPFETLYTTGMPGSATTCDNCTPIHLVNQ